MQAGFEEPLVELDAVALKIALHFRNVALKAERRHVGVALLDGLIKVTLAVKVVKRLGKLADIVAVVAVLGELNGVLPLDELEVARLDALGELFDLVAEVVDIELAPGLHPTSQAPLRAYRRARRRGALPMCMGPVGFAETNSTIYFLPSSQLSRP